LRLLWFDSADRTADCGGGGAFATAEIDNTARFDSDCDIGRLASRMVLVLSQQPVLVRQAAATQPATMAARTAENAMKVKHGLAVLEVTRSHSPLTLIGKP
jgi:hypothetical protein